MSRLLPLPSPYQQHMMSSASTVYRAPKSRGKTQRPRQRQSQIQQYYSPYSYPSQVILNPKPYFVPVKATTKIRTAGNPTRIGSAVKNQSMTTTTPMYYYPSPRVIFPTPVLPTRKGGVHTKNSNPVVVVLLLSSGSRKGGNCGCNNNTMTFDLKDDSDEEET